MIILPIFTKAECVRALEGLALPRVSHSGEIALSGSRRPRPTVAAARILLAHAGVTEVETGRTSSPDLCCCGHAGGDLADYQFRLWVQFQSVQVARSCEFNCCVFIFILEQQ